MESKRGSEGSAAGSRSSQVELRRSIESMADEIPLDEISGVVNGCAGAERRKGSRGEAVAERSAPEKRRTEVAKRFWGRTYRLTRIQRCWSQGSNPLLFG